MLNTIKRARIFAELSQTELAEKVGVTPGAVSQWESGATKPSAKRLKRLAKALKLSVDEILTDYERGM